MASHTPTESAPESDYRTVTPAGFAVPPAEATDVCVADNILAERGLLDARTRGVVIDRLARELAPNPSASRRDLFFKLSTAREGIGFLVALRDDLLRGRGEHSSWGAVEADLTQVLEGAFSRDLLDFRRIDWTTPAPLLEKLTRHEAVHAIRDWRDLRRRLDADRRCYALFHPGWPEEPLIFTELALTRGLSANMQPLLDPDSPVLDAGSCDGATFYSISSCQPGLRGFALGNALISRVVDQLRVELPRLRTFATLSPIPGFRSWLSGLASPVDGASEVGALTAALDRPGWFEDARASAELEAALMPLCARYLLHVRQGGEPADPVARFHLGNGARLRRVNWLSDVSPEGLRRSAGLTANYVYHPTDRQRNLRAYATGRRIAASRELERLSRLAPRYAAEAGGVRPLAGV